MNCRYCRRMNLIYQQFQIICSHHLKEPPSFTSLIIDILKIRKVGYQRNRRSHHVDSPDKIPQKSGYLLSDTDP